MNYASLSDMVARYGQVELIQLTDTTNIPPSDIDAERVSIKLSDAQSFVDGYVGQVYRLPLTGCARPPDDPSDPEAEVTYVPPPVLTRITCDLARYYLYDDLAPENEVYRRYKAALKELEAIATGEVLLACPWGGSPGEALNSGNEGGVAFEFSPRKITDAALKGFG